MTNMEIDVQNIKANTQLVQSYEAMFDAKVVDNADRGDLVRLAAGTLGILQIRGLISAERCAEIMDQADRCEFDTYDEKRIYPPVSKFGPSAYDYYLDHGFRPDYWEHAESSSSTWRTIVGDDDPVEAIMARLRKAVGTDVTRA